MSRLTDGMNQPRCLDCGRFIKPDDLRCEPCWVRELRIIIRRKRAAIKRREIWQTS